MSVSTVLLEADVEFEKCTLLVLHASKVRLTKIIAKALAITSCTDYSHSVLSAFPFSQGPLEAPTATEEQFVIFQR